MIKNANNCASLVLCLDKDCDSAHACSGGVCRNLCVESEDCTKGLICSAGVCKPTCTVSNQKTVCGDRFKCVLGVCSEPCAVRN